jgi:putative RecB family exonuclease
MAVITRQETQDYRSHSQLSQYTDCPRAYQLSRVRRLKRRPGAWFPGGTAVHSCIERYLRQKQLTEKAG